MKAETMFQSDAAFFIGKTHAVCQDYALAPLVTSASPFGSVWLSDGCSSSPHTDMGARLLVHTAQARMATFEAVHQAKTAHNRQAVLHKFVCETVENAAQNAACIGVEERALDATLLGLVTAPNDANENVLYALVYGDGALILGRTDDTRIIYRAQYGAGYPFYPAYLRNAGRRAQWKSVPHNTHRITKTTMRTDGSVQSERTFAIPAVKSLHLLRFPLAGLRFAAVLSDGIESFERSTDTVSNAPVSVPYGSVVHELTAFKNFTGAFVQRRMQAFEKSCRKSEQGWQHNDDLSMAAMYFGR